MMEKSQNSYSSLYHKKITAYLDGSLSEEEKAEFEAHARTHPEFENLIKQKEEELNLLKSLIPGINPDPDTQNSIENEMKLSTFNLLKEEPKNFWDRVKTSYEEWTNR